MDLARAPCRAPLTARKKGSGYENAQDQERISSFFLMGYAQGSRTSFFNTCAKKKLDFEISISTKTSNMTCHDWSLVFVLKLISTFIGQNKELFSMHVLKKDVLLLCT